MLLLGKMRGLDTPRMGQLFLSMMVTLDGFTAGQGGDLSWTDVDDREFERHMAAVLGSIDAMIYGRVSYQELGTYWPSAGTAPDSSEEERALARLMNTIPKLVVSRSDVSLDWGPAERMGPELAEAVPRVKREATKDIALFAGASVASSFMDLDLIDEYRVMVFPVTLGSGQRLFGGGTRRRQFRLLDVTRFDRSGVVILRSQPVGAASGA